jgi:hypothetical protein
MLTEKRVLFAGRRYLAKPQRPQIRLGRFEEAKTLWRYDFDGGQVQSKPLTADDMRREEDLLRQSRAKLEAIKTRSQRRYDYHAQMSQKYRQAANRPWLPLSPDPPIPE